MKRLSAALFTALLVLALPAPATASESDLRRALSRQMRAVGGGSGAYVVNTTRNRGVFGFRANRPRVLASNTKLFTTAAALARFGPTGRLSTEVQSDGVLEADGTFRGSLWLRGGGDPTFGSRAFGRSSYGGGGAVEDLAAALREAGIRTVTGRIIGDETRFDARRGGPDSGYRTSSYVGPLSALAFNRGLASEGGFSFQRRPAAFAASRLHSALERRSIDVSVPPRTGATPSGARVLATEESPAMSRIARLTNKPSDNFFAEILLKDLAMQSSGRGTTPGGARLAVRYARRLGSRPRLVDGSGLSRGNRSSPRNVVRLLMGELRRPDESSAFTSSLAVAGRDGTLRRRMRRGPARRKCRAKTGTISGVSALSGYCRARNGELFAFSILMNGVGVTGARRAQDRMAQAIAGFRG